MYQNNNILIFAYKDYVFRITYVFAEYTIYYTISYNNIFFNNNCMLCKPSRYFQKRTPEHNRVIYNNRKYDMDVGKFVGIRDCWLSAQTFMQ